MTNANCSARRGYTLDALKRYWPSGREHVAGLPTLQASHDIPEPLPPRLAQVMLPEWAADVSVDGSLMVPAQYVVSENEPPWRVTDWLGAAFWYLNGLAEREFERGRGPIHSYSFRLRGWDSRLWQRAWVNRIALWLRRWAAREGNEPEEKLFGPLPEAEVVITHDVDAVHKTLAIRCKQSAFRAFKALRSVTRGRAGQGIAQLTAAWRFLLSSDSYWNFHYVTGCNQSQGLRGHFNFYGGGGGLLRTPSKLLFDPGYDIDEPRLVAQIQDLHSRGWRIGLHQSFHAWADPEAMRREKQRLEQSLCAAVTSCRQHWLRFSWEHTWRAQQEAGFLLDTTLGFNDRPGFRNAAALEFQPWDPLGNGPLRLAVLPMVLMDSHLYDYGEMTEDERLREMQYWVNEIHAVRGRASVIWHQHCLAGDYGWKPGFETFVSLLSQDKPA